MKSLTTKDAEKKLKEVKLKVTDSRIELLLLFAMCDVPMRVKDAAEKLKGSDPVTVYRNIESFVEKGLLNRTDLGEDAAYYEIIHPGEDHHHVTCTVCKKRVDISGCLPGVIERAKKEAKGFHSIDRHSLEFFGLCNTCARK